MHVYIRRGPRSFHLENGINEAHHVITQHLDKTETNRKDGCCTGQSEPLRNMFMVDFNTQIQRLGDLLAVLLCCEAAHAAKFRYKRGPQAVFRGIGGFVISAPMCIVFRGAGAQLPACVMKPFLLALIYSSGSGNPLL